MTKVHISRHPNSTKYHTRQDCPYVQPDYRKVEMDVLGANYDECAFCAGTMESTSGEKHPLIKHYHDDE